MIMPDSPTLAVVVSLSTSQPISKIKERKLTLNAEPFSTVNDYHEIYGYNSQILKACQVGNESLSVKLSLTVKG